MAEIINFSNFTMYKLDRYEKMVCIDRYAEKNTTTIQLKDNELDIQPKKDNVVEGEKFYFLDSCGTFHITQSPNHSKDIVEATKITDYHLVVIVHNNGYGYGNEDDRDTPIDCIIEPIYSKEDYEYVEQVIKKINDNFRYDDTYVELPDGFKFIREEYGEKRRWCINKSEYYEYKGIKIEFNFDEPATENQDGMDTCPQILVIS